MIDNQEKQPTKTIEFAEELRKFEEEAIAESRENRLAQVSRAAKASLYWQGKQYLTISGNKESGTVEWKPIDFSALKEKRVFRSVSNIIKGDGSKFAAIVGQRKLNQRCVPSDPDNPENQDAARNANTFMRHLFKYWNLQRRVVNQIAQPIWTKGPVYAFVEWVPNPTIHGYHSEPVMAPVDIPTPGTVTCAACGFDKNPEGTTACGTCSAPLDPANLTPGPAITVPQQVGEQKYAKGMVEVTFLSCLHVETPEEATDLADCDWLAYSQVFTSKNKKNAILRRLGVRKSAMASTNSDSSGEDPAVDAYRLMQQLVSPDGDTDSEEGRRFVYRQKWYRPAAYDEMKDELRQQLTDLHPNGCRVHFMNGKVVFSEDAILDDDWAACSSGNDEYLNAPGLCDTNMGDQDNWNDLRNMSLEIILRCLPKTLVDSGVLDTETLERSEACVGEVLLTHTSGVDVGRAVATIPSARMPAELPAFAQDFRQDVRERNGVLQPVYGGGTGSSTWREANQKKNQALAQFEPVFNNITQLISDALKNGIKKGAKFGIGKILVAPEGASGFESVTELDLQKLSADGWAIEAEEMVPQTIGEQIEKIGSLAVESPEMAKTIGLYSPMNARQMQSMFGTPTLLVPGQYERDKCLERIRKLLAEQPMMGMDPMTGAPIEQSSVPVDEFEDADHGFIADCFRTWCNAPAGRKARESNPLGYRNVALHGLEQMRAMQAMAMPPEGTPPEQAQPVQ